MKKLIVMFCLFLTLGTTTVPKYCASHHKMDYCWMEQTETKGTHNGDR